MNRKLALGLLAALGFIVAIVAANYLTTRYGFIGVGLGLTATAGTLAAGLALGLRDLIDDAFGRLGVVVVIALGAVISYAVSDPHIATASAVAVLLSELADMVIYRPLRNHGMKPLGVAISNTVGAFVDSVVFLYLAGFFAWSAVTGQVVGKVAWATLIPLGVIYAVRSARSSRVAVTV